MTAQKLARRLITLIFAGRNRMDMIRRELPRTESAGWDRSPFRIERDEDSPFRGPCTVTGAAVQIKLMRCEILLCCCLLVLLFYPGRDRPNKSEQLPPQRGYDLVLVLSSIRKYLVAFV
jgi:hypothetical protein